MKKITKLLVLPLVIISLVGCGKIPTLKNGEEAVVTLKEGKISANDLYEKLKDKYGKSIIADMIDKIILNNKYKSTDEEKAYVKEQVESYKKNAEQYKTTFAYLLNYYGFKDQDEFEDYLILSYRRNLAVKEQVAENISDKEIEDYYNSKIFGDISAKHILISPETLDGMTTEEKEKAEKEALKIAEEVIKKLEKGEDFGKLAKDYSDDEATASKGGDLGFISTGEMDESFENAAFALKKDEYTTTPVKSSYGYYIILKTDEKEKPTLKDVKDTIISKLVEEKLNADTKLYYNTLEEIRKESKLDITDNELAKQYKEYMETLKTQTTTSE